eukprot:8731540-Pyramimonas_sp.AAC.1
MAARVLEQLLYAPAQVLSRSLWVSPKSPPRLQLVLHDLVRVPCGLLGSTARNCKCSWLLGVTNVKMDHGWSGAPA